MQMTYTDMSDGDFVSEEIARQIVSSASYAEWDGIHRSFAHLRREMPLGIVRAKGFDPFWLVTKHADILEISRQPTVFSNNGHRCVLTSQAAERAFLATEDSMPFIRALISMDPPEHGAYRRLTFAQFAPKGIRGLEQAVREIAVESISEMGEHGGSCDFVEHVALRYPLRVIMSLLGIPRADEALMLRLTQELFSPQDPDISKSGVEVDDAEASAFDIKAVLPLVDYFNDLTDQRRRNPTNDIASVIANGTINGELISHWDAMSQYVAIATAGHDTTSSSTAGGVGAIAGATATFDTLKGDPSQIPAFVEECVRWTSPLLSFMRTAEQDYELRGQTIRKGDWLMLSYASANRDEDVFDDPFVFRANRSPNPQVGFGYGAHLCIGQHLARMEMRIFFEEFFRRVASVELAGKIERTRSINVSSMKRMPISFTLS